jgi:hypothetical protein
MADKLASNMDEIPLFNSIRNILTPNEVISLYKKKWSISTLNYLKLCGKPSVTSKTNLGIVDWFHHQNRLINTTLHRLRSGHNRLNAFINRLDMHTDPLCRHGCPELENSDHILTSCIKHESEYTPIKEYFKSIHLTWSSSNLLGFNSSLSKHTQMEIRNMLVHFIFATKIHHIT